ncbi:MAG TPA: type II toxin-antitoxin system RelE/ParE family toxin [Bryobacteraceae bacterium]|nr:type II toxin-antitoxin system RelE/ParE family toxin [Bryobacteraceae bacterium]
MNWTVLVSRPAQKALAKLPDKDQRRIERALDELQADPFRGDIKRLEPEGWRRRVGNYRVFYDLDIDQRVVFVTAITRRTSTTY